MISTMDSRYPISLVKIDPLTLVNKVVAKSINPLSESVICGGFKIGDRRAAGSSLTTGEVTLLCP